MKQAIKKQKEKNDPDLSPTCLITSPDSTSLNSIFDDLTTQVYLTTQGNINNECVTNLEDTTISSSSAAQKADQDNPIPSGSTCLNEGKVSTILRVTLFVYSYVTL